MYHMLGHSSADAGHSSLPDQSRGESQEQSSGAHSDESHAAGDAV
jgi:hypothetical protein